MAEELLVVLNKKDPTCNIQSGLGFSLLGTPGLPHIIYEITENSPAAESGKVEAGDVILTVNETDVKKLNTKEVLKCLRLSGSTVSLRLRRDPVVKESLRRYLSTPVEQRAQLSLTELLSGGRAGVGDGPGSASKPEPPPRPAPAPPPREDRPPPPVHPLPLEDVTRTNGGPAPPPPKFEAFVMTGDRVLKICRNQQGSVVPPPKHARKVDSLRNSVHHHEPHNHQRHNSVPTSPVETERHKPPPTSASPPATTLAPSTSSYVVRTSKSEDHLQFNKDPMSAVSIDIDDDVTSSLNTLLDTRPESESEDQRIVWTYNAPLVDSSNSHSSSENHSLSPVSPTSVSSSVMSSNSSSCSTSSEGKGKAQAVSSQGNNRTAPPSSSSTTAPTLDLSHSEAVSNISSPDFQEEDSEIISKDLLMEVSDPSDSDSTLLVSESGAAATRSSGGGRRSSGSSREGADHRIVIQVKGPSSSFDKYLACSSSNGLMCSSSSNNTPPLYLNNNNNNNTSYHHKQSPRTNSPCSPRSSGLTHPTNNPHRNSSGSIREEDEEEQEMVLMYDMADIHSAGYQTLNDVDEDSLVQLSEGAANLAKSISPPPRDLSGSGPSGGGGGGQEEDSDVESLHSFHYSPKAVDIPSAVRLAKRLYSLDGFKKSDVSRHLSKNNEFSRAVAEEYLKYFNFTNDSLDIALRKFLAQFSLAGETQERERVLVHFSKRYLECNPGIFSSQDAVHTLTCAIMLLNTDLHGPIIGRKMTCTEFIDNLAELNDGDNFPKDILKSLYQAIKNHPLKWANDDDTEEQTGKTNDHRIESESVVQTARGVFDNPTTTPGIEYKKGYVMRKCCMEPNGKKTPLGKRGWKMYYCTLRDLVLYLHKDEHGFRNTQLSDNLHNAIPIHHALATKASDYTKKLHVFRLETAEQAVYLFQTSDSKELQSWIETINFICAYFSSPPLPGAVGSQKKFQRPLLPTKLSKLSLRDQLRDHELTVQKLEAELELHRRYPPERGAKQLTLYNYKEKDAYLQFELKRYKTYAYILRSRMAMLPEMMEGSLIESIGEEDLGGDDRKSSPTNARYNSRGLYSRDTGGDIG